MDLSINFDFFSNFLNLYSNLKIKKIFFLHFKLSNSKFARYLQNTQTQPKTQILKKLKTQTQT